MYEDIYNDYCSGGGIVSGTGGAKSMALSRDPSGRRRVVYPAPPPSLDTMHLPLRQYYQDQVELFALCFSKETVL